VIRNAKSGFRKASQRWSGADQVSLTQPNAEKTQKSVLQMCQDGLASVGWGIAALAYMVIFALALPAIKLGLFHFLSWKAYKENGLATGFVVFALSCLVIDIGLIWGAVLVAQGKLRVW
jgi:hypothetical protein